MSKPTAANFFMQSPSLAKSAELYQVLQLSIDSYQQFGNRLIQLAEQAHAFRQFDKITEMALMLSNIPIKDYQAVGNYFLAIAMHRKGEGSQDEARRLFELVVGTAPDAYKVKATLSLGALSFHRRDFDSSFYYYQEAIKAGKLSAASLNAIRAISVLKAMEGNHTQAVKDLENILPVMKYAPAHLHFDLLNSYAVELGEVGRKQEARHIARTVLASPFAFAYPEWRETAEELKIANRSSVAISSSPQPARNVLFMPVVEPDRQPRSAAWSPAQVLDFRKWKAKIRRVHKDQSRENCNIVTEKDMLVRLMEIFTHDDTTDEQRRKIWEAAENILSAPQQPESDDTQGA
jgi:tetratricopeptide (TPR) repeat protein